MGNEKKKYIYISFHGLYYLYVAIGQFHRWSSNVTSCICFKIKTTKRIETWKAETLVTHMGYIWPCGVGDHIGSFDALVSKWSVTLKKS